MKKPIFAVFFSVSLLASTTLPIGYNKALATTEEKPTIEEFDVTVTDGSVKSNDLEAIGETTNITGFESEIETESNPITVGYVVGATEDMSTAVANFVENTNSYIQESANSNVADTITPELTSSDLKITEFTVVGTQEEVNEKFSSDQSFEVKSNEVKTTYATASTIPSSIADNRPLPYKGKYVITKNTNGSFIQQFFTFSSWEIDGFRGDIAKNSFELDTVFYNYDGKGYATEYGGSTYGTWWSTNLPEPYLDTSFGDDWSIYGGTKNSYGEPSEANFSVGTSGADDLIPEKEYYYVIKVNKNTRGVDYRLKLNGQPGKQYLAGAWGAFSYYTTKLVPTTGWKSFSENVTYAWSNGAMVTGWQDINDSWYYFDDSGAMITGWLNTGGEWYYLDLSTGEMLTGWQYIGSNWYYFSPAPSGKMVTGWLNTGGEWYYLDLSTGKMLTGWLYIGSNWYYFYTSGKMAYNTNIDGYQLGSDGKRL